MSPRFIILTQSILFDCLSLSPTSGLQPFSLSSHHDVTICPLHSLIPSVCWLSTFFFRSPSAPLLSLFSPMKLLQCHQTARQPSGPCVMTMLKHLDPPSNIPPPGLYSVCSRDKGQVIVGPFLRLHHRHTRRKGKEWRRKMSSDHVELVGESFLKSTSQLDLT